MKLDGLDHPLSRLMGTSIEQLDKTYGHLLPDSIDRARAALDAFGHGMGTTAAVGLPRAET